VEDTTFLFDVAAQPMGEDFVTGVKDDDVEPLETFDLVDRCEHYTILIWRLSHQLLEPTLEGSRVRVLTAEGEQASKAVRVRGTVLVQVRGVKSSQGPIETYVSSNELDQIRCRRVFGEFGDALNVAVEGNHLW
jgi:hypothetical protein